MRERQIAASFWTHAAKKSIRVLGFAGCLTGVLCATGIPASAQSLQLLQDTETERAFQSYETPLAKAAGLDPSAVRIYIVDDLSVNAFVAEGQNIFIQTGIVLYVHNRNELVGVMAHETGHIRAGHLSRNTQAMQKATIPMLAAMVLGVAAMVAGARGDAAMAVIMAGQQMAQAQLVKFTYVQEGTADQIGMKLLTATHQSGMGMLNVFRRFANEEAMSAYKIPPFAQNHPVGQDRIEFLQRLVDASPYRDIKDNPADEHEFEMIQAKLAGYVLPVDEVFNRYPLSDTSEVARYARAMAYIRKPDLKAALAEIGGLLKDEPANPYFHEVLGQIYVSMAQPERGIAAYQKAVDILPDAPELRVELAAAQIATEKPAFAKLAINNLNIALRQGHEDEDAFAWFEAAQAYSDVGNDPMADLATAERYYILGATPQATTFAKRAMSGLPPGSPEWQRASDILAMSGSASEKSNN
ncbi:MAG TPA: M48 family metalloprotease [Rhizomicrobium sp.]|nr:M48 family metalloprotease [Rhizomicrobium sp.]